MKDDDQYIEYITGFNDALQLIEKWHEYKSLEKAFNDFDYEDCPYQPWACHITQLNIETVRRILNTPKQGLYE